LGFIIFLLGPKKALLYLVFKKRGI